MSILPILRFPDARLRRPCLPVGTVDAAVRQLAGDMLETMYHANGRGLAAPQVGVLRRLFVMDPDWKEGAPAPLAYVDPEILDAADAQHTGPEGCLSIPSVPVMVTRPEWVVLRWTGLDGQTQREKLTGAAAICAQHELDHLNGRLIIDLMDEGARCAASPCLAAMGGAA
ncbi:MAG: peptide deformylase [Pararhodobacter sp.]|nr:peptide deformylase [Pararhodobacter sp.]